MFWMCCHHRTTLRPVLQGLAMVHALCNWMYLIGIQIDFQLLPRPPKATHATLQFVTIHILSQAPPQLATGGSESKDHKSLSSPCPNVLVVHLPLLPEPSVSQCHLPSRLNTTHKGENHATYLRHRVTSCCLKYLRYKPKQVGEGAKLTRLDGGKQRHCRS